MRDPIERQEAIDSIVNLTLNFTIGGKRGFQNYKEEVEKIFVAIRDKHIEALKALPSAQPEIIRCEDCKYSSYEPYEDRVDVYICNYNHWRRSEGGRLPDWHCADGKRRKDGRSD